LIRPHSLSITLIYAREVDQDLTKSSMLHSVTY